MTVEERITVLKLALLDAQQIIEAAGAFLPDEFKVAAYKQVLNQIIYARIEEWGEQQRDDGADGA